MKIGIDCRTIGDLAGVGTYTRELVSHILEIDGHNHYVLFFDQDFSGVRQYEKANVKIKFLPSRKLKKFLPIIYSHLLIAHVMNREKLDLCLFLANVIPLGYQGKAVLTVHDLAVYKFSKLFPDKPIGFDRRVVVPFSARRADKIIAVSENTKRDIIELFKIPAEKIKVVYEGCKQPLPGPPLRKGREDSEMYSPPFRRGDSDATIKEHRKGGKYFLFLGTIEPRKNLKLLIESYTKFVQLKNWAGELILAGGRGWKNREIFEAIAWANDELKREAVKYLGYVGEAEKQQLLAGAYAFVYPSLYEGFGLPVLEAMSFGVPVITSDVSSLPEICGDGALLINPERGDELVATLEKIASDDNLRRQLAERGQKKSQEFTWDDCAAKTLAVLASAPEINLMKQ